MEIDYSKLGFKSGLEIHQQLDTSKLFCKCPSVLRSDEPDFEVTRKLHAVAGESGQVDVAAKYQSGLNKNFVYQGYDTTCLVELDEEPPHEINPEALETALHIALLLKCKIIPLAQIMRKTVIDGSNTSGFQRTVMIARHGYIETSDGKVGIEGVFLEEDAARPVSRNEKEVIYKLDRLGIPLVEIATAPDIKSAKQAKETALKLGDILRSCKVRRGIGTIRQDVNLSIAGGKRIEIKGFQDIRNIERAIEIETERQIKLVKEKKSISEVRNVLSDSTTEFLRPMPGEARMYPETDLPLLKIPRDLINKAKKNLPKLKSEIEKELKKKGLKEDMIKMLFKQNKLEELKQLIRIYERPEFVARMILIFSKDISKKENKKLEVVEKKLVNSYSDILELVKKGKLSEREVKEVMVEIVRGKSFKEAIKIERADVGEVEEKILKIIKEKPGLSEKAYMGLVMKEFRGKVGGKTAMQIIKKYVK